MIKNHLKYFTLLLFFFTNILFAQQRNLWSRISETGIRNSEMKRKVNLKQYKPFALELTALKEDLKAAPNKRLYAGRSNTRIVFPDGNGQMLTYLIKEASVMHPELEKKYPQNKSYAGVSEKDGSKRIRFSINELGLHAIIMDVKGEVQYIEPLTKDKKKYRIFYGTDLDVERDFECLTGSSKELFKSSFLKITDDLKLRTYRLALAGTGEYSQFHIEEQNSGNGTDAEKKAVVLAAMTTAMTKVNAIFENDLAVTMQLVANNDDLIYLDPNTDPYTNFEGPTMLGENQANCDAVIEPKNYDIGHVFSTGGGGVASLSVICRDGVKARGVTGLPEPTDDFFYFDFVAHEMGHQFGANHTFNGDQGTCGDGDQRNEATAIETGSGSSLMSYAGLCGLQNVQGSVDPYFHIISIEEIRAYVTGVTGGGCAEELDLLLNQNVPLVDAGEDFTIPRGTPFKLVGSGSDADGDLITFSWEQIDNEITIAPPSEFSTSGASYRAHVPSLNPVRYLPSLNTLATGVVSSTWEVTPNVARELNFLLTVRDNNIEAGQVASDDLKVTVTDAAGPFLVTSQNTDELVWTADTQELVTWDVAGTDANGLNVSQVNILLSTDWGKTFSTVLAANVPNDGSQIITVPEIKVSQCFVMVEAIGNNFFSLNTNSFSIGQFNEICTIYDAVDTPVAIPDNDREGVSSVINISENVNVEDIKVILISKDDQPDTDDQPGITHTYLEDLTITLESPQGTVIELISGACGAADDIQVIITDSGDPLSSCNSESPGISGIIKPNEEFSVFNGENTQGNWTLKVVDDAEADSGFLQAWSLEICSSEAVLGVNNYVFDDFTVFPNPSTGKFIIKFQSEDAGDVDVFVYDVLGRKVVQKTYKNLSNDFEQEMNLQDVAGGIYILSVKRGNKMSSHKIRIN